MVYFVDLVLYVQVNNFQLGRGGSSCVKPVLSNDKCVLHKETTQCRGEARTHDLRSRVKYSTTEPLCSPASGLYFCAIILILDLWFRRCRLKYSLSRALAVLLLDGAKPFVQCW